jgi:voltage-gated potassium channel
LSDRRPPEAGAPAHLTRGLERWRAVTDAPLLALAIGTVPLLFLEVEQGLPPGDRTFLKVMNVIVLVAFAVDYLVELALARPKLSYVRNEWTSLAIVVAQAITVVPEVQLPLFGIFRILRAGRAWRAVAAFGRVIAIGGAAAAEGRAVLRRHAAGFALAAAGMTWVSSAVAFTMVEDLGSAGLPNSFFDGLWWSTTTITTVGYGDVSPKTAAGRVVGGITMVVGISTFAVVTAKVAEFLVRTRDDA